MGTPGQPFVPEGHSAREFRYSALKEKYGADEEGDVTIDQRDPEEVIAEEPVVIKKRKAETKGVGETISKVQKSSPVEVAA